MFCIGQESADEMGALGVMLRSPDILGRGSNAYSGLMIALTSTRTC